MRSTKENWTPPSGGVKKTYLAPPGGGPGTLALSVQHVKQVLLDRGLLLIELSAARTDRFVSLFENGHRSVVIILLCLTLSFSYYSMPCPFCSGIFSVLIPVPHFQKMVGVCVAGGSGFASMYAPADSWGSADVTRYLLQQFRLDQHPA